MLNKVMLIGNLGADPELRSTQSGQSVCSLRLATSEKWTDKQGEKQEKTEWHRIVVWGDLAENVAKYCKKGKQIFVEGKLQTRSWEDQEGTTHWSTEVVAMSVKFLGGRDEAGREERTPNANGPKLPVGDDDIPF